MRRLQGDFMVYEERTTVFTQNIAYCWNITIFDFHAQLFQWRLIFIQRTTPTKQRKSYWCMPHGRLINAEFSLQRASHNSREIIQQ